MSTQPAAVLHSVLADFPAVQHAFAYGSGVFEQPGLYARPPQGAPNGGGAAAAAAAASSVDQPMLDFIFAVDDPVAWHTEVNRGDSCHARALDDVGLLLAAGIAAPGDPWLPQSSPRLLAHLPPLPLSDAPSELEAARAPLLVPGVTWPGGDDCCGREAGCGRLLQHPRALAATPGVLGWEEQEGYG